MRNTTRINRFYNTIQKQFSTHTLLNSHNLVRLFLIFFITFFSLNTFAKEKTRITERGSSLFYRSWRYPQVTDSQKDKEEKDLVKDSLEEILPDSTLIAQNDSIINDNTEEADSISNKDNNSDTLIAQHSPETEEADKGENGDKDHLADNILSGGKSPDKDSSNQNLGNEDDSKNNAVIPTVCVLYFKFDQSNYTRDYSAEIDTILQFIDYHQGKDFLLTAHTDERGTVAYNQALSERRAKQLFKTLVERGVDPKRLTCIGRSELEPAIRNAKTEREHQLNRRVVISVKE